MKAPAHVHPASRSAWIAGGRKWTDEINVWLNTTYSIHTLYLLTLFILTPIFRHLVGDEPLNDPRWKSELDAGGLNAMDLMNIFTYAHTWCFLSAMWGMTVTMYNPWTGYGMRCCLKPVSAARFFASASTAWIEAGMPRVSATSTKISGSSGIEGWKKAKQRRSSGSSLSRRSSQLWIACTAS